MGLDFLVPIFGILLVLVPVLGITTVLTLRYGLKPFIETLAQELRGTGVVGPERLERRVEDLTAELAEVAAELRALKAAQEFDRRLLESRAGQKDGGEGRTG